MKLFVTSIALFMLSVNVSGQAEDSKESLRGLKGIFVNVPLVAEDARKDGLSTEQLQETVVTQLRKAGVTISAQPQLSDGYANLVVIVDTIKHPQGVYVFTVTINVLQSVRLTRLSDQKEFSAETWGRKALGLTTPKRMDVIQEPLKEKLDEFIKDYFSVNPKRT